MVLKSDNVKGHFIVALAQVLLVSQLISSLQTVPGVDNLLGPGQCPTGSFCVDTNFCTSEYYATKTGLPFYCGPHHKIDSMICCIGNENTVIRRKNPIPAPAEYENELEDAKRTNRSVVSEQELEDDEVNILSIPFPVRQNEDTTVETLLSMMDDVSEQEGILKSGQQDSRQQQSTLEEETENVISVAAPIPHSTGQDQKTTADVASQMLQSKDQEFFSNDLGTDEIVPVESRAQPGPRIYPSLAGCQCEKGEKGDPGPSGEPGKVVYLPIFYNNGGIPPLGPYPGGFPFVPGQPLQNQYPFGFGSHPFHPNPTVIPYGVPISHQPQPTPVSQQQFQPPSHLKYPVSPRNQVPPPQGQPSANQPQPEPQVDTPLFDDLQARLQRHSQHHRRQR